ncbi:hypothetical protein BJ165DRAFT_1397360 [Panaeolus papilionaceus]|nr:hypothetical protein BJ165DRAFT_1397360 [Panaeolus papilionaceus]
MDIGKFRGGLWGEGEKGTYLISGLTISPHVHSPSSTACPPGASFGEKKSNTTGHPLPLDLNMWRTLDIGLDRMDALFLRMKKNLEWWQYLDSFFNSQGYVLYTARSLEACFQFLPLPHDGKPFESHQQYPYARRLYKTNKDGEFPYVHCVRAARDEYGQDVVIRIVSGPEPSDEFKVLKRLSSPAALRDPINITIPILDWLEFGGLVFIVMPRWNLAWIHDFEKVSELMDISDVLFSYLDFLHDNRVAHMDFHSYNIAINTIVGGALDFGASVAYPYDTPLDAATHIADNYSSGFHGLPSLTGPFNPFHADVGALGLGTMMEVQLRVIEHVVPQIGPFVDAMRAPSPGDRPTAKEVYRQFKAIKSSLTQEQLDAPVLALRYDLRTRKFLPPFPKSTLTGNCSGTLIKKPNEEQ